MTVQILEGDCREQLRNLPERSVHCCVTSPPYFGLRDYGVDGQMGLEESPDQFSFSMAAVFREVRRALTDDGTLWLNLGDSYGKAKQLLGIPWRVAFALQDDGWYLRDAITWAKPNCMPGSQNDRCTSSYEMVFQLSKSANYWSDFDAIKTPPKESSLVRTAQDVQAQAGSHRANGGEKTNGTMKAVGVLTGSPHGRHSLAENVPPKQRRSDKQRGHSRRHDGFNDRWDAMEKAEQQARPATMRNVWFVPPHGYAGAHFAVMPEEIARRCILAGCPVGGTVLDPFFGAGTTGLVASRLGRNAIGVELNPAYATIARERINADAPLFANDNSVAVQSAS